LRLFLRAEAVMDLSGMSGTSETDAPEAAVVPPVPVGYFLVENRMTNGVRN
jgi:hypothetical protein